MKLLVPDLAGGMGRRGDSLQDGVSENGSVFTDAELRYLSEFRLGRIATVGRDGTPDVAPVGWSYDPERDVIEVGGRDFARSKKYHDVRRSRRAAIVIDDPSRIRIRPQRIVSWGLDR